MEEELKIKFIVSAKEDINEELGKIAMDYEETNQKEKIIVISKKNGYRIKKTVSH